jgi:hypothetical protein
MPETTTAEVTYLSTLQFHWGGLFDSTPADNLGHLVRGTSRGTPGPVLCGIERFGEDAPGFSVGGGVVPHGVTAFDPCGGCVQVARDEFPGLPVVGLKELGQPLAAAIGTAYGRYSDDVVRAVA